MGYINEYLLSSSIHGFRYLSSTEKWQVRLVWFCIVLFQFGIVSYSMYNFNRMWQTNPALTQISIKSIKDLPFPDISTATRVPMYWTAFAKYLEEGDEHDQISVLFEGCPKLKLLLLKSVVNGARFKIHRGESRLPDACASLQTWLRPLDEGEPVRCSTDMLPDDEASIRKMATRRLGNVTMEALDYGRDFLTFVTSIDLYRALTKHDLIGFLALILAKGPEFLRRELDNETMTDIYGYITQVSKNIDVFNGLPVPSGVLIAVSEENGLSGVLSRNDTFDPMALKNYALAEMPDFYDAILDCLQNRTLHKTCPQSPKYLAFMDEFQSKQIDNLDRLVENLYSSENRFPICSSGVKVLHMLAPNLPVVCSKPKFLTIGGTALFESSGREVPGIQAANALQKKVMGFIIDEGRSLDDNPPPTFELQGQETHSLPDFVQSRTLSLELGYGQQHMISVEAEVFDATESYEALQDEQKECLSSQKLESYRISNCIFDKAAIATNVKMKCRPVYTRNYETHLPDCSWFSNILSLNIFFYQFMNPNGACIPSCKETKYALKRVSSNTIGHMMSVISSVYRLKKTSLHDYLFANKTGIDLLNLVQFETETDIIEKKRFSKIAIVDIGFGTSDYRLITRDVKATFFDKLSLIGGTLGLYTGFSVVSLIEIAFWFGKWFQERRRKGL